MASDHLPRSADLLDDARRLGFYSVGVAEARRVDEDTVRQYELWVSEGRHASMEYIERYPDLRADPRALLPGARSVIVVLMNYHHPIDPVAHGAALFAEYARGTDYHIVMRSRLDALAGIVSCRYGGETRVTVDTAPMRERYWAVKAGLGFIGRNSQLIVPGAGSRFFIGTIITTVEFDPDSQLTESCLDCGRCISTCPGGAIIAGENRIDARRCLSYLTIEHRGEFPPGTDLKEHLYGCDVCQTVCPHNAESPVSQIAEFSPRPSLIPLTIERVSEMSQEEFSKIFSKSAVKRTKLAGLQRNAREILRRRKS